MHLVAPETRSRARLRIQTQQATSDDDLLAVRALWRCVYGGEFGWLGADADPRTDGYHERSTYYLSYANTMLPAATMRIVDAQRPGFHITDAVHLDGISCLRPKIVEVQRLMVHADFRDRRLPGAPFGIYGCMIKACLQHALKHEVDLILADCHRDMTISPLKSLKSMGFRDTGKTYVDSMNGLVCVILTMETRRWLRNIFGDPTPFSRYLIEPDLLNMPPARFPATRASEIQAKEFVRRMGLRRQAKPAPADGVLT